MMDQPRPSLSFQREQDRLNRRLMEVMEEMHDIMVLQAAVINDHEKRIELLERGL